MSPVRAAPAPWRTPAERLLLAMLHDKVNDWDANHFDSSLWGEAIALARAHGVAPVLHEETQRGGLAWLPDEARRSLRSIRLAELLREERREKFARAVFRALGEPAPGEASAAGPGSFAREKNPLRVLVIKGAASARTLYAAPELRPRGDLDLLVLPEERERALGRLASAGFVQHARTRGTREDQPGWHERTLVHPAHGEKNGDAGEQLDLHFALAQPERHRLDARRLFAESEPFTIASAHAAPGLELLALRPEAAALLCAHAIALHELAVPLISLFDLVQLLAKAAPQKLAALAGEVHLRRALSVSLRLLARLGTPLGGTQIEPSRLASLLETLPMVSPIAHALDAAVNGYSLARAPLPRAKQLWRKALFIDRPQDAARFALGHALQRLRAALPKATK